MAATHSISRRGLLQTRGTVAGMPVLQISGSAQALGADRHDAVPWLRGNGNPPETYPGSPNDEAILWQDQPPPFPPGQGVGKQQVWEELSTRLTPAGDFFFVGHYGQPTIDPTSWRLGIDGLVAQPGSLSLADLKLRPRKRVEFTLECSGNTAFPVSLAPWATR
jgi:DMSO/TMAO reductase YedYZ molybdopterin-dependent catalytic subunit